MMMMTMMTMSLLFHQIYFFNCLIEPTTWSVRHLPSPRTVVSIVMFMSVCTREKFNVIWRPM